MEKMTDEKTSPSTRTREVTRVLTYIGPEDWMDTQLGGSLPDGVRATMGGRIVVTTLPSDWGWFRFWRAIFHVG
jgi:hypothetical protein